MTVVTHDSEDTLIGHGIWIATQFKRIDDHAVIVNLPDKNIKQVKHFSSFISAVKYMSDEAIKYRD
jgi:hypothetical protein